jgi:hypothetical protein
MKAVAPLGSQIRARIRWDIDLDAAMSRPIEAASGADFGQSLSVGRELKGSAGPVRLTSSPS